MRVGVFDSGVGGLTVLATLRHTFPFTDFFYLGDSARAPYGTKDPHTVQRYARECAHHLVTTHAVEALVVACNTASTIALARLRRELSIPIFGVVDAAVSVATERWRTGTIGVIGTTATIRSGVYQTALARALPNVPVWSAPCPLFVPLVEEGLTEGPIVDSIINHYLWAAPEDLSVLILGCTHYPLLSHALSRYLPRTYLVDCGAATAWRNRNDLRTSPTDRPGLVILETTAAAEPFSKIARNVLSLEAITAQEVCLTELPLNHKIGQRNGIAHTPTGDHTVNTRSLWPLVESAHEGK